MHSNCTARRLMILLCAGTVSHTVECGDSSAARVAEAMAIAQYVNKQKDDDTPTFAATSVSPTPSGETPIKNGSDDNASEETIEDRMKRHKVQPVVRTVYDKKEERNISLCEREIKFRADLVGTVYRLENLVTKGDHEIPPSDEYEAGFLREKKGKKNNPEKENALKKENKDFLKVIALLRADDRDIVKQYKEIKEKSLKVALTQENRAKFVELMDKLEQVCKAYTSHCKGKFLLQGEPGNGKTSLAKEMICKNGAEYVFQSSAGVINEFQGSGPAKLERMFKEAIAQADRLGRPVGIFLDEVDAFARNQPSENKQEFRATTQQYITLLDRYETDPRVIVLSATNFYKTLHDALRNRYSKHNIVSLDNPKLDARKELLNEFVKKLNLVDNLTPNTITYIAEKSDKFSNRALLQLVESMSVEVEFSADKKAPITAKRCQELLDDARIKVTANDDEWWEKFDKRTNRTHSIVSTAHSLLSIGMTVLSWFGKASDHQNAVSRDGHGQAHPQLPSGSDRR